MIHNNSSYLKPYVHLIQEIPKEKLMAMRWHLLSKTQEINKYPKMGRKKKCGKKNLHSPITATGETTLISQAEENIS